MNLFEHATQSQQARDRALIQMDNNNEDYFGLAISAIKISRYTLPMEFTGEYLKHFLIQHVGPLPHRNITGGIVMNLIRQKIIEPTGSRTKANDKKSHARSMPLYRFK